MTLNKPQLVCLWLGIIAFILLALVPPWYEAMPGTGLGLVIGHAPLWSPPGHFHHLRVDSRHLTLEWTVVAAITLALLLAFRTRLRCDRR